MERGILIVGCIIGSHATLKEYYNTRRAGIRVAMGNEE